MDVEQMLKQHDDNWKKLYEKDQELKAKGELIGRYIQESYADGYAVYTIEKVKGKKVLIAVVTGIGDDWHIPYWGAAAWIDLKYAKENVDRRDRLDKLFEKR